MLKITVKLIATLCSLVLIMSMMFCSGVVSATEAIAISTKEELNNVRNNLSASYYLTCDIVFTKADFEKGGAFYNNGIGFSPIGTSKKPFTGSFDGRGYSVIGLKTSVSGKMYNIVHTNYDGIATVADDGWTGDYIIKPGNTANTSPAVGLFGFNKGEIKNLSAYDFNIKAVSENGSVSYVGGIAGYNVGLISGCSAYGTVSGDSNSHCGLILGYLNNGEISNCYAFGSLDSFGDAGGVLGSVRQGLVKNVYSKLSGEQKSVGFRQNEEGVLIEGCYYISTTDKTVGIGDKITPENAKTPEFFAGFDFENVWSISKYQTPILAVAVSDKNPGSITGDADKNGIITLSDVSLVAQKVAAWDVELDLDAANATRDFDSNGNNLVTLADVSLIAQNVAGWDSAKLF